jgi:type IV pilus assembly protein PilV
LDNAYIMNAKIQMETSKKENGYTLIEVLIALTIFAVGMLAVAGMQTSGIRMNSTAGKLTNLST